MIKHNILCGNVHVHIVKIWNPSSSKYLNDFCNKANADIALFCCFVSAGFVLMVADCYISLFQGLFQF